MGERAEFISTYENMGLDVWSVDDQIADIRNRIVRCRDCQSLIDCGDHYLCVMWGCPTEPDGYCHKGERVDND